MAAAATVESRLQSMSHTLGDLLPIVDRAGGLLIWREGLLRGTRTFSEADAAAHLTDRIEYHLAWEVHVTRAGCTVSIGVWWDGSDEESAQQEKKTRKSRPRLDYNASA